MQHGGRIRKFYPADVQRLRRVEIHRGMLDDINLMDAACTNESRQQQQTKYSFHLKTFIYESNLRIPFQIATPNTDIIHSGIFQELV